MVGQRERQLQQPQSDHDQRRQETELAEAAPPRDLPEQAAEQQHAGQGRDDADHAGHGMRLAQLDDQTTLAGRTTPSFMTR